MATFFTADTHFGDHRTINIRKRPFASTAEMDAALIANWNAVVAPDDIVWHLGDVVRSAARLGLVEQLNGAKHLITGNNDSAEVAASPIWESAAAYAEIMLDGRLLILCHYPFRSWRDQHKGSLNLHGHSHGRLKPLPRQFDVGADARGFAPVMLADLLA